MGIGSGTALAIGGLSAAGGIGGAAIAANAAGNAANKQANAANQGLAFNEQVFNTQQQNQRPYIQGGQNAVAALNNEMGLPFVAGSGSNQPLAMPTFNPPLNNPNNLPGQVYPRWKGGPVAPATRYMVGEKGPEELDMLPGGGGVIIPHNRLRGGDITHRESGGTVNYTGNQYPNPAVTQGNPQISSPQQMSGAVNPGMSSQPPVNPAAAANPPLPGQLSPFTNFVPPTLAQAQQEPGYAFAQQQGENAILNNASALGTTGSPVTSTALEKFNQGLAEQDYNNVYNRAFNTFETNQNNQFNRLASIAGLGQTSVSNLNNNAGMLGQNVAQGLNNSAAAQASGIIGGASAYGGAIGNAANSATLPLYLQLLNQGAFSGNGLTFSGNGGA